MKKIALISAIALSGLFYNNANAQILQIGLHLGGGRPVVQASFASPNVEVAYSNADDYYYLPEVDAYYNVAERNYYYNDGVRWVSAAYLPGEYRNYDWRNARHYEIRERRPFLNADVYREKYRGNVGNWNRNDDRFDNRNYANRDDRRDNGPRFEKRNDNYRGAEPADNRGWDSGNRRDDNSVRGNYNQSQPGRGQDNNSQQGRNQGGYGQSSQVQPQQQQGRGQGGYQQAQPQQRQPSQQQGGGRGQGGQQPTQPQQNQPSRQNGNGQQQRGHDINEQFANNRGQEHSRFGM